MAKLIIFGTGDVAQIAAYYFAMESEYEVVAFTANRQYIQAPAFEGKPVVPFEEIAKTHPPGEHKMFIALSYSKMNKVREEKYHEAKKLGYQLPSYVSKKCTFLTQYPVGDNCFIFEDNTIQPFVRIGNNVVLWSGNHIGHHSVIQDHNFISSHVVISGHCTIESNCFVGVNSTLGHNVTLASRTLVGAGSVITKNTEPGAIYVPAKTVKLENKTSDQVTL